MANPIRLVSNYAKRGENAIYGGYDDESGMSPEKERFLRDARRMLYHCRAVLGRQGFSATVRVNKAGPAVSGEVGAHFSRSDIPKTLYAQIGSSPQMGRGTDGVYILIQHREKGRIVGANLWLDANLYDSQQLAAKIYRLLVGTELP